MKSVVVFGLVLTVISLRTVVATASGSTPTDVAPSPHVAAPKAAREAESPQCKEAKSELKQCVDAAQKIPNACRNLDEADVGQIIGQNGAAGVQRDVGGQVSKISQDTANRCNAAYTKCDSDCESAMKNAESVCLKPDQKQKAKEAAKGLKAYCANEGKPRADKAQEQASANREQQQDGQQNGEKNQGQQGGSPQAQQAPQSPQQQQQQPPQQGKKTACTAENAGTETCPVTPACVQTGGVMNPNCSVNPVTGTGGDAEAGKGNPVLKSSSFEEDDRRPASPDITAP